MRALLAASSVLLALVIVGCSSSQPAKRPAPLTVAPAPSAESTEQALQRLFGSGARMTIVETRTIGQTPSAYVVIATETTPSAAAILGVLVSVSQAYGAGGREIALQVDLPEGPSGGHSAVTLRWNPSGVPFGIPSAVATYAPGSLLLDTGYGGVSRGVEILTVQKHLVPLGSGVATQAVLEGARGEGAIWKRLRAETTLP